MSIYKPKDSPVNAGMEVVFRDINVKKSNERILRNVSGIAKPGRLLTVMGPSGCGKTTLLDALMGRNAYQSGEITLNGQPFNKQIKRKLSYVIKDAVFFPNVTLRETLRFAAMLRLPDAIPIKQKLARMESIIDTLDIRKCLDIEMGNSTTSGLTDGDRMRASIACELITNPLMIVIDEPTADLDAFTSISLIKTLKAYTQKSNKTVIMTTQKPSSQIFHMLDQLLLLSEGQVIYFGDSHKVMNFFENIGLHIEPNFNPADFILEKLDGDKETREKISDAALDFRNSDQWPEILSKSSTNFSSLQLNLEMIEEARKRPTLDRKNPIINIKRKISNRGKKATGDEEDIGSVDMSLMELEYPELFVDKDKWPTSFFTQFKHLTVRTFWQCKSRIFSKMKLIESVLLCVIVSLVWFQLPRIEETLRDRMGAIFFIVTIWGIIPLIDAVTSFATERAVIDKERTANWYRLSAYYVAKMTSEIPLLLIPPIFFLIFTYWIIGLNNVGGFFGMIFTIIITAITGQSLGLFVGIAFTNVKTGVSVSVIAMTAIMLLGGFFTRNLPFWLDWVKYFSFIHYSFHCSLVLEFYDGEGVQCLQAKNESNFMICKDVNATHIPPEDILSNLDIHLSYIEYFLPLLFFAALFRLLGYLLLRFVHYPKLL
ncbi:uncharacterized protein LOC126824373 [Patella vulgata]|uniref:uncharacterized protein LOC126824373 n=1 Tax=Patella vulgata TaxID=6465 RepID=UPI00217FB82F|nr:uncharacterized protein LOC126824373 [Patella vulgata]XP_050409544.1 uncharacterized protein LOC126824373 [Patella vulgata]XP_050409545.1 uncharacterized protein LOC126824373 [Patella vulgata]XP_050409546.1 uncharacterized protein LOC126824373 [Patella vulgata]